jgi:hypothetical protein
MDVRGLSEDARNRVYRSMCVNDRNTCVDASTVFPIFAHVPDLHDGYLRVHLEERSYDLDLVHQDSRVSAAAHLGDYGNSIVSNATKIHIFVNDDGNDRADYFQNAALRFTLGPRLVDYSFPSAGSARKGHVHVVFDSLRGSKPRDYDHAHRLATRNKKWGRHNVKVAMTIAAAINTILRSHGANQPHHITASELMQVIGLLDDIHGVKLNGFGYELVSRHIDDGAATEFWDMVERN